MRPSKIVLNEFLSAFSEIATQRGYDFYANKALWKWKPIYVLDVNGKILFFEIHVSTTKSGFWGIAVKWHGKMHQTIEKLQTLADWAVLLLKTPQKGFLIPRDEFTKMVSDLRVRGKNEYWQIKLEEKDLPLEFQFYDWDTFFQILKL